MEQFSGGSNNIPKTPTKTVAESLITPRRSARKSIKVLAEGSHNKIEQNDNKKVFKRRTKKKKKQKKQKNNVLFVQNAEPLSKNNEASISSNEDEEIYTQIEQNNKENKKSKKIGEEELAQRYAPLNDSESTSNYDKMSSPKGDLSSSLILADTNILSTNTSAMNCYESEENVNHSPKEGYISHTLIVPATPKLNNIIGQENEISTPPCTPKQQTKTDSERNTSRPQLTPYSHSVNNSIKMIIDEPRVFVKNSSDGEYTVQSIRKRSLSVSEIPRKQNRVTFHSPANSAIPISYIDEIMKSNKKTVNNELSVVTQRRKRSLSVSETKDDKFLACEIHLEAKQLEENTLDNHKNQSVVPVLRTKLPNFSAIHQNFFNKLESITDHIARKNDRAKNLSTTKKKIKTESASKLSSSATKPCMETTRMINIPKARQKINLSNVPLCKDGFKPVQKETKQGIMKKVDISPTKVSSLPVLKHKGFNVSTVPDFSKITSKIDTNLCSIKSSDKTKKRKQKPLNTGEQTHEKLYKNRSTVKPLENNQEIIRGVRSNRRFELQMMCRANLNK